MKFLTTFLIVLFAMFAQSQAEWKWEILEVEGEPVARHEAAFVAYKDKMYLIGGRRINPTSVFDPETMSWENKAPTPMELHHFQPVVFGNAIYLMGAMTGKYPNEKPLERIIKYLPEEDRFEYGDVIPESRRRGGAGVAVYEDKIYMVGGITRGHMGGYQAWLDEYDPNTGQWRILPDAPNARDHCQAAIANDQLFTFGGRLTSKETENVFNLTVAHGNIYDLKTGQWIKPKKEHRLPTLRAGNFLIALNDEILVAGGESDTQEKAHAEVEAYNFQSESWNTWPSLNQGRHGTGIVRIGDYLYTASGCGNKGGKPELSTIERLEIPRHQDFGRVAKQFHKHEIDFAGPHGSETGTINPFTAYDLQVSFTKDDKDWKVRGFFAADGNAGETSSTEGNIWRVRFAPPELGEYTYTARLNDTLIGVGSFVVTRSDQSNPDFKNLGFLGVEDGYFKTTQGTWLKMGTNSPENLLAYEGFDGTYRVEAVSKDGEAMAPSKLHQYNDHKKDWKPGDNTWKDGNGKGLIGGLNYLAGKGLNSVYFLTMNINGDGKDVWPYISPEDFSRFDVSKLAQWELVFEHMNELGIALHIVLQETENERLLDDGNLGAYRKIYLDELISRFGHHPGLIWNIGEENGPAPWVETGSQNNRQREDMIMYLKTNDPYRHPVLLHTLPNDNLRDAVLDSILSCSYLDGLSLQADQRKTATKVIMNWHRKSSEAGKKWLISMDEIGEWHTGALRDDEDPGHPSLRGQVLWGSLLSGGAGVEWYFGAKSATNDLGTEEWRNRDQLWTLTNNAKHFFEEYLPIEKMNVHNELINKEGAYCLAQENEVYAIYLPSVEDATIDLRTADHEFEVWWYDIMNGGALQEGSISTLQGGSMSSLGTPKNTMQEDWVVLLKKLP